MAIEYQRVETLSAAAFLAVLRSSGLAERRPVEDEARIGRMLRHANLLVVARDSERAGEIIGVARALTDFSYCCYLADLAVDRRYQEQGVGSRLIAKTREVAGPESMCLLLSAPAAMGFYRKIGMEPMANAFQFPRER